MDLKKAAKLFANKFACGSSVTKNNQGNDEIVVQGDVSDEIFDLILEHWPIVSDSGLIYAAKLRLQLHNMQGGSTLVPCHLYHDWRFTNDPRLCLCDHTRFLRTTSI